MSNPHPLKKNQWKKGQSGNPNGKPLGTLDFKTKWFNFIEKVAKQNDISPDEVDEQLLAVAFKRAKDGDYQFYRDTQDRVHGKPQTSLDITTMGEKLPNPILGGIAKKDDIQENNSGN